MIFSSIFFNCLAIINNLILEAVLKSFNIFVKHNLYESQLYHWFSILHKIFIIDGQFAEILQPREKSFYNSSFRQGREFGWTLVWSEHDFNHPTEFISHPIPKRSLVISIGKYLEAPLLSWRLVSWTATARGSPSVSTTICSFLPLTFLFSSIPLHEGSA